MASEETIEAVADVIEDVVEVTDEVITVVRNNPTLIAGAAVVGLLVGGFAGYKIAESRLRAHYDEMTQREVEEAKAFYSSLNKKNDDGKDLTPEDILAKKYGMEPEDEDPLVEDAAASLFKYAGKPAEVPAQTEEELMQVEASKKREVVDVKYEDGTRTVVDIEKRNIFAEASRGVTDFDYQTEIAKRSEDEPYIITSDEYFENEPENEQTQLTYFEKDDVLVDDKSVPVPDSAIVGDDNLNRFGYGSKDKNIVYIRNEALGLDFEVVRSNGSVAEEVFGFDSDSSLRHSDVYGKGRRFRHED